MNKIELPDFEDMIQLARTVGNNKTELLICKNELDFMLGEITQQVNIDEQYWLDGKRPSNAHIKDTYHVLGLNEATKIQLLTLRSRIAELEGDLRANEALFSVYQDIIGVWRTQSANERGTFLE
jgi:hypothetical protein